MLHAAVVFVKIIRKKIISSLAREFMGRLTKVLRNLLSKVKYQGFFDILHFFVKRFFKWPIKSQENDTDSPEPLVIYSICENLIMPFSINKHNLTEYLKTVKLSECFLLSSQYGWTSFFFFFFMKKKLSMGYTYAKQKVWLIVYMEIF